ncbi:hypothetical protein MGYG_00356 [Nannizzia gypsea CBS 118893]|uniref:Uncharacterized protein n=1 Tax=Arthroderma gypseum (strain ATCC MYA-4604 / CBS 118893) TaxID=535722 RepID=E5QZ83_ARTGP|nr:hypothetical protein MGYG_00356 [Nannizzia gypsea CBS 118893]EFQ97315.1 hypothetical protein MGYG_00356 [Nannizzia gypsea CBS 118893]
MFEGFSFPEPTRPAVQPEIDSLQFQCDSNLVSPLSSRCPSPRLPSPLNSRDFPRLNRRSRQFHHYHHQHQQQHLGPAPTSIPADYATERSQRFSIGSLTKQLHAHSLETGGSQDIGSDSDDSGRWLPITPPRCSTDAQYQNFALLDSLPPQSPEDDLVRLSSPFYPAPLDSTSSPPPSPRDAHVISHGNKHGKLPSQEQDIPAEIYHSMPHSRSSIVGNGGSISSINNNIAEDADRPGDVRYQREKFSMLQCASSSIADTVRLAILLDGGANCPRDRRSSSYAEAAAAAGVTPGESCDTAAGYLSDGQHPSSLPPSRTPSRKRLLKPKQHHHTNHAHNPLASGCGTSSRFSGAGSKGKVEKSQHHSHSHGGSGTSTPNPSRKFGKSQYGLRRRSLLLAAVTAVLEQEVAESTRMTE